MPCRRAGSHGCRDECHELDVPDASGLDIAVLSEYGHRKPCIRGERRVRGGRAPVSVALYMATLSAVRWDPLMKAHYQQLSARGKLGKVALVACVRTLLGIVNAKRRDELRSEGGTGLSGTLQDSC